MEHMARSRLEHKKSGPSEMERPLKTVEAGSIYPVHQRRPRHLREVTGFRLTLGRLRVMAVPGSTRGYDGPAQRSKARPRDRTPTPFAVGRRRGLGGRASGRGIGIEPETLKAGRTRRGASPRHGKTIPLWRRRRETRSPSPTTHSAQRDEADSSLRGGTDAPETWPTRGRSGRT